MYRIQKYNSACVEELQKSFERLPLDAYLKQKYRYRRFSRFQVMSGNLIQLSHKHFVQAIEHNSLLGEIKRDYQELESDLTSNAEFKKLIFDFVKLCGIYWNETEVGVHQIRIMSTDKMLGYPTPEGVHVDGFDFVGIFCADRNNIQGGETCLYLEREAEPIYRRTLEPGEFLIFDDRKLLHYTSQVESSNSNPGTRDVFILTASVRGSQISFGI